jgi:hypothetical protein
VIASAGAGKFVALDLAACTIAGPAFNPGGGSNDGKSKIVSLVLPDAATSIQAGVWGNPTFGGFTVLDSLSGSDIEKVGQNLFQGAILKTVDLPKATEIGNGAFYGCALPTVYLPEVKTIINGAFMNCSSLVEVDLPKAETISYSAFVGCTNLKTVDLPAATFIDHNAFENCYGLTTVNLPVAMSIGGSLFARCRNLTTVILGSKAPTLGADLFYDSAGANVTVKVPAGATGYGDEIPKTYSDPYATAINAPSWGNGFRGGGWDGSNFRTGGTSLNDKIPVNIQYGP